MKFSIEELIILRHESSNPKLKAMISNFLAQNPNTTLSDSITLSLSQETIALPSKSTHTIVTDEKQMSKRAKLLRKSKKDFVIINEEVSIIDIDTLERFEL